MLLNIEDHTPPPSPALCGEVGKDCRECVRNCAETMATLCPNMAATHAESMFFRIYPYSGCVSMARAFVREYLTYSDAFEPEAQELVA